MKIFAMMLADMAKVLIALSTLVGAVIAFTPATFAGAKDIVEDAPSQRQVAAELREANTQQKLFNQQMQQQVQQQGHYNQQIQQQINTQQRMLEMITEQLLMIRGVQ